MKLVRNAERLYIKKHLRVVRHITLNPEAPGVIRIHMVPPKNYLSRAIPYLLVLNGQYILPIGVSWAILLSSFIDCAEKLPGKDVTAAQWDEISAKAVEITAEVYPQMKRSDIKTELLRMLKMLSSVAKNGKTPRGLKPLSITEYAKNMTAPHRIDLMISTMKKDGCWNCNQKCLHCYAAGQSGAEVCEMTTEQIKKCIDKIKKANIPQITFTGGEPTLRKDLVELVKYSEWFVTRLNTNGRLLTSELCEQLYAASLDNVQVTVYSHNPEIHNSLVGANGFEDTINGIKNAIAAGLCVSVNTPLCSLNSDYEQTISFLSSIGVKYFTCSGLIPSGNATTENSTATRLTEKELEALLTRAVKSCHENNAELSFTSPGQVSEKFLSDIGLFDIPACGACLSNMAVAPDGKVIPCQSWLSGNGLGNLLTDDWKKIWNSPTCKKIREVSAKRSLFCQLDNGGENL